MKLKRFISIVISLAMVLSIVPAFSLTASAESLAADAELVFDGMFADDATTYSVEFTMGGSGFGYRDVQMKDIDGNQIGGFCYAGPTDGFYPNDRESLSSGFSANGGTDGSTKWTSGSTRMRITFTKSSGAYTVVYTAINGTTETQVASLNYTGTPNGITHPNSWGGGGNAAPTFTDVVVTEDGETVYDETSSVAYGTTSNWYAIEFTLTTGYDNATGGYRDYQVKDANGNQFTGFCFAGTTDGFYPNDRQQLSSGFTAGTVNSDNKTTWTSFGTRMRIAVNKTSSSAYTVTYTKIESGTETELANYVYNGAPSGISLPYTWAKTGGSGTFAFANVEVYAVVPESTKDITATYTVGGTTVKTQTQTIDTSATDSAAFDAYYYRVNGTNTLYYAVAQTLTDSATIEMTLLDNWGNYAVGDSITANNTPYKVASANIVPNGNFEYGMNGWYARDNSTPPVSYSITTTDKPAVSERAALSSGAGGASSNNSIKTGWDITIGKTYYYSLWVKAGDEWHGFGESDSPTTESQSLVANKGFGTAGTWVQKTGVFTATQEYLVFFEGWGSVGLADVEVYEVEVDTAKIANTTIKFVDSSDGTTEIQDAVTITGVVGDVIDLSAYNTAITYNGNPYSFDDTNSTSYTVVGNNDVVTLTYTTDAYVSFKADAVTVIEGNDPIMPTTVTAVTGAGSETVVSGAVWTGYTGLSAGTHTVNGTVVIDGTTVNGSTTVTVLSETFTMNDVEAHAGQSTEAVHYFPVAATGEVAVEFDVVFHQLVNGTITIGDAQSNGGNNPVFGGTGDAISIQTNSGGVNIRSWGTTGGAGSADRNVTTPVVVGDTYRFLITTNTNNDTWNAVMTDKNGVQTVVADGHGYRKVVDKLDSITVLDNNGVADTISVSNIKIYAPAQASALTEYTIVVTGSVTDSYTEKAQSVDALEIPYYPGNIFKSRSVSGTTVTYTYEASVDTLGTWAIRNNVTSQSWISEMKYLGTHNSFADNDSPVVNEGGALAGVTGASTTGSLATSMSQTQTADALEQLNMGVRYFDIRLTRQEDGTFWSFHGPAFSNFNLYAHTIGQWAKEHPGEVIILDFHESWDALYGGDADGSYAIVTGDTSYYGEEAGDDNQYYYTALEQLLTEAGIMELVPTNFDQRYGAMTAEGTKTAILTVSKGRGANCIGKFQSRDSWTSGDTTYVESSSVSTVANTIESAITAGTFGSGAKFGTIHAYVTPTTGLVSAANTANTQWTNYDLDKWMTSGYGDIFMVNNVTQNVADTYLAILSEYNRDYLDDQLGSEFHGETALTAGGLTMTGSTTSVPFSTEFVANPTNASGTYTIDGKVYTAVTSYDIALMQFDANEVQPTGDVTVTFPRVSTDDTTVDAIVSADGTTVYATSAVGQPVSITTAALADVILTTVQAPGKEYTVTYVDGDTTIYTVTEMVPYGQVVYSVPAGNFYLAADGKAYILNSATASSHTAVESDTTTAFTVDVTVVSENAVLGDTFANNEGSTDCNNTENLLFVGSSGISDPGDSDADAAAMVNNGGNVGSPRIPVLTFNVPTVADGQAVKLNLYVAKANQNLEHGSMKLAVGTADIVVDEALGYVASSVANTANVIWSDQMFTAVGDQTNGRREVNSWVTVDVTDLVKAAEGSTITFTLYAPTAGAYVADREKAVAGGAYEGKAAYLDVVDAYTVKVSGASKITKAGNAVASTTEVVAYEGAPIKLYETSADHPAFTNGTKVYATDNTTGETGYITVTGDDVYYAATVGVAPVDGAQVRIGDGVNADGKVTGTNSGLRFITTVDGNDTLAGVDGATFGVEITAEGNTEKKEQIPAEKWQTEGSVFTSAITNLAEGNFNRKFTATPYVTADGQTFYGTPVTRSIYQVAAGLLVNDATKDGDSAEYDDAALAEGGRLYKVLNAYVNQTGIRLQLNSDKTGLEIYNKDGSTSNYSGDVFFTVVGTTGADNVYTITIKPAGSKTTINDYWQDYIRINNNNSKIAAYTSLEENEDGSVTITFDYARYLAENAQ